MRKRGKAQRCFYCHRTLEATTSKSRIAATKDHPVPERQGGKQKVWCCRFCNGLKGGTNYHDWLEFMITTPEWWKRKNEAACDNFRRRFHHL